MSVENLKDKLPEFAKDLKLNLSSLTRSTELPENRLWGVLLATAAATKNSTVLKEIAEEAKEKLSPEYFSAALGAASIMGMNNVFYSARGELAGYETLPAGLRMNIIANSGVPDVDFETWSMAVSAINHCKWCLKAHEQKVIKSGSSKEELMVAIRIASTMSGVAQAISIVETLGNI